MRKIPRQRHQNDELSALPYFGGKSGRSSTGTGRWVASLLPYRKGYVEPFGGMAGVLLQRRPSYREIYNDLDGDIVDWWTAIRECPMELADRLNGTPYSRQVFEECVASWGEGDLVERAWKVHVVFTCKMPVRNVEASAFSRDRRGPGRIWPDQRFEALGERMRNVVLERMDAVKLLRSIRNKADQVIYCDPPYRSAGYEGQAYEVKEVDWDALTEVLLLQKGLVGISGYGDEWDHLGWCRSEWSTNTGVTPQIGFVDRTEVLWTNFEVHGRRGVDLDSWGT